MILLQMVFLLFEIINSSNDSSLHTNNIMNCNSILQCVLHHFVWLRVEGTKTRRKGFWSQDFSARWPVPIDSNISHLLRADFTPLPSCIGFPSAVLTQASSWLLSWDRSCLLAPCHSKEWHPALPWHSAWHNTPPMMSNTLHFLLGVILKYRKSLDSEKISI